MGSSAISHRPVPQQPRPNDHDPQTSLPGTGSTPKGVARPKIFTRGVRADSKGAGEGSTDESKPSPRGRSVVRQKQPRLRDKELNVPLRYRGRPFEAGPGRAGGWGGG